MSANKRDILIIPVAICVLLGWAAALVYGLLTNQFLPLTVTTPLMLLLAGFVFGVNIVNRGSSE